MRNKIVASLLPTVLFFLVGVGVVLSFGPLLPICFFQRFVGHTNINTHAFRLQQSTFGQNNFNLEELYSRIQNLQKQESLTLEGFQEIPVICFDALLPRQRLVGDTSDETFCQFLKEIGIGGIFCMVSLDHNQRKLRRDGVLCKIEIVDASAAMEKDYVPTAVDFSILGLKHCRIVGPSKNMRARVGRWRRSYDPDGEESILGWGIERFIDRDYYGTTDQSITVLNSNADDESLQITTWTPTLVQLSDLEDKDAHDQATKAISERIPVLLDKWQQLASNERTYENVEVVATSRRRVGFPGLRVDAAALLRNVRADLGEIPSANNATDLAFYGAALINPLPALGVSPEIRGRVLAATSALERLQILEWGINRSMRNLQGIQPL